MEFRYGQTLLDYMEKKNKRTIVVELVEVNNSDFEITELNVRFVDRRMREHFLNKKHYRLQETAHGEVLLPRFPLELEDMVTFELKRILFYSYITYTGIRV